MREEKQKSGGLAIFIIFVLIIILAAGAFWFFGRRSTQLSFDSLPAGRQLSDEELAALLKDVGKLIVLPEGTPLVATVQDAESLKKVQAFFELSQNGDRLLVFPDKALIYRPGEKRLINVGPVYRTGDGENTGQTPAENPLTIDIRNGSDTPGAGRELSDRIGSQPGVKIANITNASNNNYTDTIIVNLTGKGIGNMQQFVDASQVLSSLPANETASNADVVIIVGGQSVSEPGPEETNEENQEEVNQ